MFLVLLCFALWALTTDLAASRKSCSCIYSFTCPARAPRGVLLYRLQKHLERYALDKPEASRAIQYQSRMLVGAFSLFEYLDAFCRRDAQLHPPYPESTLDPHAGIRECGGNDITYTIPRDTVIRMGLDRGVCVSHNP